MQAVLQGQESSREERGPYPTTSEVELLFTPLFQRTTRDEDKFPN